MLASSVVTNSMQGPLAAKVTDIHHLPQYIPEKDTILRNVQLGGPTGKHYEEQKHHGYRRVCLGNGTRPFNGAPWLHATPAGSPSFLPNTSSL